MKFLDAYHQYLIDKKEPHNPRMMKTFRMFYDHGFNQATPKTDGATVSSRGHAGSPARERFRHSVLRGA